jgi:hypothetical protein
VERVRDEHPGSDEWRADAFAQSRHTNWSEELRAPLEDHDPGRAAALCAEVTRQALRDFAPALILLSEQERRRAQALSAYTLVLFDFARQTGMEGERLSQINRLEFDLERALDGDPPGQPVFVMMAAGEKESPWPRECLDQVAAAARSRAARPRPATDRELAQDAERLADAIAGALLGSEVPVRSDLAAGLLRLTDLLGLGEAVRRHRPRLSEQALPEDWIHGTHKGEALDQAIRAEAARIRELLTARRTAALSPTQRRACRYLQLAGARLLRTAERQGGELLDGPPALGAGARIALLSRARLGF